MLVTEETAAGKQFIDLQLTHLYYCSRTQSSYNFTDEVIIGLRCRGTFIFLFLFCCGFFRRRFIRLGSHGKAG